MTKKAYLAHNFNSRFHVRDVITPILEKMFPNVEFMNPFMREGRENQGLYERDDLTEKGVSRKMHVNDIRPSDIVENDLKELRECDMLIAFIENASVGTSMEILYNSHLLDNETILVFQSRIDLFYHPFLNYFATRMICLDDYK